MHDEAVAARIGAHLDAGADSATTHLTRVARIAQGLVSGGTLANR